MLAITHSLTRTKLGRKVYNTWHSIKARCYDLDHKSYKKYGAKGIKLQESWENDVVLFHDYVVNLPLFCKERSLDRIDNSLGYFEGNIRWATKAEQSRNQDKQKNNTSGTCGVLWYYNLTGGTRAVAYWEDGDRTRSKSFSQKRFGLLPSFKMAVEHRDKMIAELNVQGAGYTENHGK